MTQKFSMKYGTYPRIYKNNEEIAIHLKMQHTVTMDYQNKKNQITRKFQAMRLNEIRNRRSLF